MTLAEMSGPAQAALVIWLVVATPVGAWLGVFAGQKLCDRLDRKEEARRKVRRAEYEARLARVSKEWS